MTTIYCVCKYLIELNIIYMGNKAEVGIAIHTQKPFYLPGDIVQGMIYINSPKPYPSEKIIIHIKGTEKCWFRQTAGNNPSTSSVSSATSLNSVRPNQPNNRMRIKTNGSQMGQNTIIQANFILVQWNKESHLHGQYAFPFVFQLPSFIPGSFEEETPNYQASIKYVIKAICISPKKSVSNIESVCELSIRQPQRNKQQSLYGQIIVNPTSCICRSHGVSRVCCYFQKNQYMPGEQCIAICEADNYKCSTRLREVKVEFYKEVILTSVFGQQRQFLKLIRSVSFPGIGPNDQYTGTNAQKVHLPLKYRQNNSEIHPSTQGRLIQCRYFLQVTPIFGGLCKGENSFFRIQLRILQQGLIQPKIEEPEDWSPQVYKKSEIFFDHRDLQNENLVNMKEYSQ